MCFSQAEDGIRVGHVTGVQTCALPIFPDQIEVSSWKGDPAELNVGSCGPAKSLGCLGNQAEPKSVYTGLTENRSEERRVGKECRNPGYVKHKSNSRETQVKVN